MSAPAQAAGETRVDNARSAAGPPRLSIATPFFRNEPVTLIAALAKEAAAAGDLPVELIAVDDGSGDADLFEAAAAAIRAFPAPARLIGFHANRGRSAARNRLIDEARGRHILFLDSDMAPDRPDFLRAWLSHATENDPAVSYGGYSTLQATHDPAFALARALAEAGDCRPAAERAARGALAVATSNLLVRADVLQAAPFDAGFSGWGWEDVDWALRAAALGHAVTHVDIPATHLGLDRAPALLDKYAKAGPNFARILERHPDMESLPATRAARLLSRVPGHALARGLWRKLASWEGGPMGLRTRAAKLWRASHAAGSLKG